MSFLPRVKDGRIAVKRKGSRRKSVISKIQKRRSREAQKVPKKYAEYIESVHWIRVKQSYYRRHKKACAVCNTREYVDLHHMVYRVLGKEKDEDLVPLCRYHHDLFHNTVGVKGNMLKETHQFIIEEQERLEFPRFS